MVAAMIFVFVAVTLVVLSLIIYFAVRNPAYLFNPSDISEAAHLTIYGGGINPPRLVEISEQPQYVVPPELDIHEGEPGNHE